MHKYQRQPRIAGLLIELDRPSTGTACIRLIHHPRGINVYRLANASITIAGVSS